MDLVKIERKTDVELILKECLDFAPSLDGVIVLGLTQDGAQILRTSTMSAMEKSFMCAFLNAWMTKWFQLESQ